MDFQEFGIDPRLASAILECGTSPFLFEKMLSRSLKDGENVCAKISLDEGREAVFLLPALQWILASPSGGDGKVLVVAPDRLIADKDAAVAGKIGKSAGIESCVVDLPVSEVEGEAIAYAVGDATAAVAAGTLEALIAASDQGLLNLREFGFLVVDGAERLAERSSELIRKLAGSLLPSWERRSILVCERITVKAKNLAWDLADNPSEISIDGEVAKAQSVEKETWRVEAESKLRFLLGRIAIERPQRLCVFCNLRDSAEELSRRLEANGISSDYILGALAVDRKRAMLDKAESGRCSALVLTDQGAEGLPQGRFPLVVNYDFPLEPELFVKRLEMLDRNAPGAKVLSLACDRYIYGLPAVEQYIDAKLDARTADETMLAAEDMSASKEHELKDAGAGTDSRGRDDRRPARYGTGRDDRGRRDAGRRDGYPREDRGPDIRRSIAEATGGSLDVGGDSPIARPIERERQARPEARSQPASNKQGGGGRRDPRRGSARNDHQGRGEPKRGGTPASRARAGQEQRTQGNPYELPMEERMKRYREKYGQRIAAPSNRPDNSGKTRPGSQAERDAPRAANPRDADMSARKGNGVFGKLFSSIRKKE